MERDDVDRGDGGKRPSDEKSMLMAQLPTFPCWASSAHFLLSLALISLPQCLPSPLLAGLRPLFLPKALKPVSASEPALLGQLALFAGLSLAPLDIALPVCLLPAWTPS